MAANAESEPIRNTQSPVETEIRVISIDTPEPNGTHNERGPRRKTRRDSRSSSNSTRKSSISEVSDHGPLGENATPIELFRERRGSWTKEKPKRRGKLRIPRDRAIVVRWEQDDDTGSWEMHSITIQSPHIRQALHKVFEEYPTVSTELDDLTFRAPFHEFFFRWSQLEALIESEADEKIREHCELLRDTLKEVLQTHLERAADLRKHGVVTFEYLWTLFEPGSEVYARIDEQDRLFLVEDSSPGRQNGAPIYTVQCRYIDYDGEKLGFDTAARKISYFKGVKPVTSLLVHPSSSRQDIDLLQRKLESRGRRFLQYCGLQYKQYHGFYWQYDEDRWPKKQHMAKGRIVIDAQAFGQDNYQHAPSLDPLDAAVRGPSRRDSGEWTPPPRGRRHHNWSDSDSEPEDEGQKAEGNLQLQDDQFVYCIPLVRGFDLTTKKWAGFNVTSIEEIDWSIHAFERLLLKEQYKKMILAFVKTHLTSVDAFDDIIKGKGQGFIMLLSGDPGVGKTLTAESVAEEMHQPLYAMSAGELGGTTYDVETSLQRVLKLCAKWHAVLLIDECDVFLEQRTTADLERNRLVAVFLRLLEYYKGVLIMTTNRASAVDQAFQSRIHLSVNYPNLDLESRKQIWRTFTSGGDDDSRISEAQLDGLAAMEFNGREIKNIARSARLLAARDEVELEYGHLQTVLDVKLDNAAK